MENNENKNFLSELVKYLNEDGYSSKISFEMFSEILTDHTIYHNDSKNDLIKSIKNFLNTLVTPITDFLPWKNEVNFKFQRNVKGFNKLKILVNSDYDYYDYDRVERDYIIYVMFEVLYRINYSLPELLIDELEEFKKLINLMKYIDREWWFRGHSNEKWDLDPTILRGINRDKTTVIDYVEMDKMYSKYGLTKKYKTVFTRHSLNYDFLAYMQHSTSYSPMIDFTTNFITAVSFALSNKSSINDFYNIDSSIVCVRPAKDIEISTGIKKYKVGVLRNSKTWTVGEVRLILTSFGRFFKPFADVSIERNMSNDRMKYQHGRFVMYDNFISFPNHSTPIDVSSRIIKIVIDRSIKEKLYEYVMSNYSHLKQDNLMNPYKYFSE